MVGRARLLDCAADGRSVVPDGAGVATGADGRGDVDEACAAGGGVCDVARPRDAAGEMGRGGRLFAFDDRSGDCGAGVRFGYCAEERRDCGCRALYEDRG